MSKNKYAHNETGNISRADKKVNAPNKLTAEQKKFLAYYGFLIQHFNVPEIAKVFGVKRQSVQNQIDKERRLHEED